jgi:esterase/lipase superfamily enzyme
MPITLPTRRLVLANLAALPLGGCLGTRGAGFTAQATEGLGEEPVLHVLTTRRLAGDGRKAPFLEGTRASQLSYHRAHLAPPDRSTIGRISGAIVNRDFAVKGLEPVSGPAATTFAEAMRGQDTFLFVHGFNQTFETAAYDAAVLADGIRFRGQAGLFSWASKGGLLDYGHDRESALLARDLFADALSAHLLDPFGGKLHIVAHSMGTLVTLETLRSYRDRHGDKGADRMGALVLAAPDIDRDVFVAGLNRLGAFRERITVITATNDRALDLSRRLAGGDRVGALAADQLQGLGIRVIDATEFATGLVRHDVFVSDPDVRAAIKRAVERA